MKPDTSFWQSIAQLITTHTMIIDRPRGASHPRYKDMIYPLDYGYLEHTSSGDGDGIDVWLGSLNTVMDQASLKTLTGILCTFDRLKCDTEIKLLIGCDDKDIQVIRGFYNEMATLYIPNPMVANELSN